MLDEIVETAIPWGGFLAVGALLGASFPEQTQDLARRAAVIGMRAADKAREIGAEAVERVQDILAEAEAERHQERRRAEAPSARLTVVGPAAPGRRAAQARPRTTPTSGDKPTSPRRRPRANPKA